MVDEQEGEFQRRQLRHDQKYPTTGSPDQCTGEVSLLLDHVLKSGGADFISH